MMHLKEKISGGVALVAWIVLFSAGLTIDSSPYRTQVNSPLFSWGAFLMVILTYTPTNVAILSLFSGYIAGCASLITHHRFREKAEKEGTLSKETLREHLLFRTESPLASMFRSIVVYFGFMAGVLVTTVSPFTATTPEQYIRLASAISFFAFVVGYDPTKFSSLLGARLGGGSDTRTRRS